MAEGRRVNRNSESFVVERDEEKQSAYEEAQQEQEEAAAAREIIEGEPLPIVGGLRGLSEQQEDSEAAVRGEGPPANDPDADNSDEEDEEDVNG